MPTCKRDEERLVLVGRVCTFSYAYCSCSMMGSLSRKALMQGATLRPTMPCFFSAVRQVASTWLDAMKSLEQLTTSTSWRGERELENSKHSLEKATPGALTFDLLEQTATPTSGIHTMF